MRISDIPDPVEREKRRRQLAAECDATMAAIDWPDRLPGAPSRLLRPQPKTGTIYFIAPAGGPIKIGFASSVETRLKDLRLANAFPLEVLATVEGPPSLERDYHRQFAAHRLHGEWFARCPEIEAEIARLSSLPLNGGGAA